MLDAATIAVLTDTVDEAQSQSRTIAKLTNAYPSMTIEDGYAVQDELLRRWESRGRQLIGLKAGLTSKAKMAQMGVDVPSFGMLMGDTQDSEGGAVDTSKLIHPRVEAEIAFIMKRDLSGKEVSIEEIYDATDYVQPAIEVIDSRYENFKFDLQSVIADNSSSARFVLGGQRRRPEELDLATVGIKLDINNATIATASSGAVLGHPAHAIQMLVSWLHTRGRVLPAGFVILSGAATEAVHVHSGDVICAHYEGMGSLSMKMA